MPPARKRAQPASPARRKVAQKTAGKRRQGRPTGQSLGREAVLRVVCGLLKTRSYHQVTIAAVARELRVDPALIRYYFRDHATLMAQAGETLKQEFRDCALAAAARSDGTPEGLLRGRISALIEIGRRYRFALRLLIDLAVNNPKPSVRKSILELTGEGAQFYARVLAAGAERGALRPLEPLFVTMAVLAMADVFTIQEPLFAARKRLGIRSTAELEARYQDFMVELILDGVKIR